MKGKIFGKEVELFASYNRISGKETLWISTNEETLRDSLFFGINSRVITNIRSAQPDDILIIEDKNVWTRLCLKSILNHKLGQQTFYVGSIKKEE